MTKTDLQHLSKAFLFWAISAALFIGAGMVELGLPRWALGMTAGSVLGAAMVGLTWLFLKSDTLTFSSIGMTYGEGSLKRFFLSFTAGMLMFGGFFLTYLVLTPAVLVDYENLNLFDAIVVGFLAMFFLAAMEEIAFRGYLLRKLGNTVGIRLSIYLTAIVFGLYHGWSVDNALGPAIWGLWYGVLAYWSKGLAAPIGLHAGVNYMQLLFGQKERWASGIWTFDLADHMTVLTVAQVTAGLQVAMFIGGLVLVEIFIAKSKKAQES